MSAENRNNNNGKLGNNLALIIGGTSLFGRYMAPKLLALGQQVVCTYQQGQPVEEDAILAKYTGGTASAAKSVWTELDVLDKESIKSVLEKYKPNVIYDFAVQNSVGYAWKQPNETVDINIIGALNVFDSIKAIGDYYPRLLMAGSGEEYGRMDYSNIPLSEELQPTPNNLFAATKVEQSLLANIYYRAYAMDVVTVRTFNEIGPGMSGRFSISNFCKQFAQAHGSKFKLHVGNINIERDYTDVRDLVDAFIALSNKGIGGEVYNAGAGRAVRIGTIIDALEEISGKKAEIVVDQSRIRPIDTPKLESNNQKIEADTGWKANIDLRETIKDIYKYWQEKQE